MAPLRPSAGIPHVGTQKDTYGLRFPIFTTPWLMMKYIPYIPSWLLCHFAMLSCIRDSLYGQLVHHSRVSYTASHESLYSRVALLYSRK